MSATVLFCVIAVASALVVYKLWSKKGTQYDIEDIENTPFPPEWEDILKKEVRYFNHLNADDQELFRKKVLRFIHTKRISGGGAVKMTTELQVLTAASAVIPVLHLTGWPYFSLSEVVLTPDNVRNPSDVKSMERTNILGMVYNNQSADHVVFLSEKALRDGFKNNKDSSNVGIHEFAHMVDADDGIVDGVPAMYMPKELVEEWKALVKDEMELIAEGETKINPYAATNEQEFFAVLSETFFENPDRLKKEMPRVYQILSKVYRQGA